MRLWFGFAAVLTVSLVLVIHGVLDGSASGILFPRPFAVAIDDLGWNQGHDEGAVNPSGPYRLGLPREMLRSDYEPLVEIAAELGIRLQGAFILAEMDRENVLRDYPTTTSAGVHWDNSENIGPDQLDVMAFVRDQAAFLEFGLHGVGHEFWPEPGVRRRAEWYNLEEDEPWPREEIAAHIEAVKAILAQYGLSEAEGHSFPESFVPGASGIHWDPEGDVSTGSMLRPEGVRFANTAFSYIKELDPPEGPNAGGFDHGLLVVNRQEYGNVWDEPASLPTVPIEDQESDLIETHWTNFLTPKGIPQARTNERWIRFFRTVQEQDDRYLAKNSEQFASQWLYRRYAEISEGPPGEVLIDNSAMPREAYEQGLLGALVLKVKLSEGKHLSRASLDGRPVGVYYEDAGFGFLELPPLDAGDHRLSYTTGDTPLPLFIDHRGTYNIYSTDIGGGHFGFQVRVYGTQDIHVRGVSEPTRISIDNGRLRLLGSRYLDDQRLLVMTLGAHDIQGETGRVNVEF